MKATKWNKETVGREFPALAGNEYGRIGDPNLHPRVEVDSWGCCSFRSKWAIPVGLGKMDDEDEILFFLVKEQLLDRRVEWGLRSEYAIRTLDGGKQEAFAIEFVVPVLENGYWWYLDSGEGSGTIGAQIVERIEMLDALKSKLSYILIFRHRREYGEGRIQKTLIIAKQGGFDLSVWASQRRHEAVTRLEAEMPAAQTT